MSHPFAESKISEIVTCDTPLAPLTWLSLGGPAQYLARPRNVDDLHELIRVANAHGISWRVLAGGFNVLVRDQGVNGLVIHLVSPAFSELEISGHAVHVGSAVPLTALISQTARAGLSGLEQLTGVPGTVGGAVKSAASTRGITLEPLIRRLTLMDADTDIVTMERQDLAPGQSWSDLVEHDVILDIDLELGTDNPEAVVKRMRNVWILKKEHQPYGHQASACIFCDPRPDRTAESLIEQAGLKGSRIGGAEVSIRNANYIVAEPNCSPGDVLRLIDLIRGEVERQFRIELALRLEVW
jgi:UDP-N-acetylmuramate dehydrogenase